MGDRVSFFVIAGDNSDEIYEGYRQLTGVAHMLPKAAYGYIQSKAIYQREISSWQLPKDIVIGNSRSMSSSWIF